MKNAILLLLLLSALPSEGTFAGIVSIVQRSHGVGDTPNSYGYAYRYSGYGDVGTGQNVATDNSTPQAVYSVAGGESVATWNASGLSFPIPNNYSYAGMVVVGERSGIVNAFATDAPFDTADIVASAEFRFQGFTSSSIDGTLFVNFRTANDTLVARYINDGTFSNSNLLIGGSLNGFSNVVDDLTEAEAAQVTKVTLGFEITGPSNFAGSPNLQMIGDNFQLTFNQVVNVPEPTTTTLLLCTAAGVFFYRPCQFWRRRSERFKK